MTAENPFSSHINAIIIDDELNNVENLNHILNLYCEGVKVIATANSAKSGFDIITRLAPDVVFLDIEMPYENGFQLLERFNGINFEVVFVTAFNQYAVQAIRFCALDYLLKPINIDELKAAINRVRKKLEQRTENERLRIFLQHLEGRSKRKIALSTLDEIKFVEVDQIIYCLGENNYTCFFLTDGKKIMITKTLKEYEELLSPYGFARVHRSYLVNLNYVKSFVKKEGGYILMANDAQVSVSKNRKDEFLQRLAQMNH